MEEIGKRIKTRRTELKLKQLQIKDKTGISSGNLSDIENGKKLPSAQALIALSETLQCSIDWILTGKEPGEQTPEERELVERFRKCSKAGKKMILDHAAMVQEQLPEDPRSSVTSSSWNIETGTDN